MRTKASLRFLGLVFAIALVFGSCGSLTLGAFDKQQTLSAAPLFNPGNLFHFDLHFLHDFVGVITSYTDRTGVPFHNYFLLGVASTIAFCFLSMPLALLIGFVLALMSRAKLRIVRVPARTYVEFFRNTPLVVQLLAIYGLFGFIAPFPIGVATLVLNYAAYECENLRAGIESLDRGQREAAEVLGLSRWQTLRLIIVPQMIPTVLPPVINDLIYLYKDSSVLSLITITELIKATQGLSRQFEYLLWQFYLVAAIIYLLLSLPFGRLARWVEGRLRNVNFSPKRDLTVTALQVLAAALAVGWLCEALTTGISLSSFVAALGQILTAVLLSITIIMFIFCTLGLAVYLLGTVWALVGGAGRTSLNKRSDTRIVTAVSK